ncbi:psychosine receptor isoform X1 [Canis lupus familiaris]|uniref:psychosine receptor isoform X1 n=1 Tax=Canis lupus familiaris TaxID=9615 RepID=UPI0018F7E0E7|nr:psychosine receptor isoform X1 [Canis lupus familiaris]
MNSTCIEEQHYLDHYLFPVVYIFVVIASVPANIGSLCVSFLQAKKENELGIYLFSLSLSDLLYTLTLPLWIDYTLNNDNWTFSPALCKSSAFFMYMNFYSSTAFLTCIAIDRYLAVVHPLKFSFVRTRRFAFVASLSIWVLETMFNGVILWEDETAIEYCDAKKSNFTLCYDKYPLEKWQISLNLFRTCTGYAIPLVIIMICNQKVYQAVQHNQATEDGEKEAEVINTSALGPDRHWALFCLGLCYSGSCCMSSDRFEASRGRSVGTSPLNYSFFLSLRITSLGGRLTNLYNEITSFALTSF